MRKLKCVLIGLVIFSSLSLEAAEFNSLSQLFQLGGAMADRDGDSLTDSVLLRIIIPDSPSAEELALASDIAARANLESLCVDFSLVVKESEVDFEHNPPPLSVIVGSRLGYLKALKEDFGLPSENLNSIQGRISLHSHNKTNLIYIAAGSPEILLKTGRAFFLRWPYLWDIWGREEGQTYPSLEEDLEAFLNDNGIEFNTLATRSVLYEFPSIDSPHDAIKRLRFNTGEISDLVVQVAFAREPDLRSAQEAFEKLETDHNKGQKTDVLNYSGCRQLTLEMEGGGHPVSTQITRIGLPGRFLTPAYDSPVRASRSGKSFDLLNLFSAQGVYADGDRNSHADGLDSRIIIPQSQGTPGAELLASRLVLDTTGASFPIVELDTEIKNPKSLVSPILIGRENLLTRELIKTAKLKIPPLENGWGYVTVVPEALNLSSALIIDGADSEGLEQTLSYMSQTFPYLKDFQAGETRIHDVFSLLEEFLEGEHGTAEAYLSVEIDSLIEDIKDKDFESIGLDLYLPQKNDIFIQSLEDRIENTVKTVKFQINSFALKDNKVIFEKEKNFPWEKDEALRLLQQAFDQIKDSDQTLTVSVGLSESPQIRKQTEREIGNRLRDLGLTNVRVNVFSSYKQGFFWLTEKIMPALGKMDVSHLVIRFAEEKDDFSQPKRFYSDPYRWLQELYPVDDIIAKETAIPLENIVFEKADSPSPVYEVFAYDNADNLLLHEEFSPRTRKDAYLRVLPEWGNVKLTTGWVMVKQGSKILLDRLLKSDMERFWDFYQDEIMPEVYAYIMKKTGNEPAFTKQPYFKRLLFELWLSEPDYKLGLDEEIISSLESIHDELYFDTLDFIRGITEIELEDESLAADSSRYSAPGNILPLIHPSTEGQPGRVKVAFEDWQAKTPQFIMRWKEKGKTEQTKKVVFPSLNMENPEVPSFVFNGKEECIEKLFVDMEFNKESEYTRLIEIIEEHNRLQKLDLLKTPFVFPRLKALVLSLKFKDLIKEEIFPVIPEIEETAGTPNKTSPPLPITPTDSIISPNDCLDIAERLGRLEKIQTYVAGRSFENREIPVLEIFTPHGKYVSLPRLVTFKPTLFLSGRQHANEVSSTNYILKFAELLATETDYEEFTKRMNFVLHPLENPDGAALAYDLQKLTPSHSLHAGRYTSLGIDVSNQINSSKPLLPEAKVRGTLYNRWLPDIYLNLHGYPSHEWVQQFSNYSPYLFRNYWIPKGWFAYYRSLSLPIYEKWVSAGNELKDTIVQNMTSDQEIQKSNTMFYDRYFRWAARWQPHMNYLEREEGLNLYSKRRSSRESLLSNRRRLTFVEETPELMDETARGPWLDFLVSQGLTYLFAHAKYLSETHYEIVRIEEEGQDRISIQFVRDRPGSNKNK